MKNLIDNINDPNGDFSDEVLGIKALPLIFRNDNFGSMINDVLPAIKLLQKYHLNIKALKFNSSFMQILSQNMKVRTRDL